MPGGQRGDRDARYFAPLGKIPLKTRAQMGMVASDVARSRASTTFSSVSRLRTHLEMGDWILLTRTSDLL